MSADKLREAARVLRERAEAATPGPWDAIPAGAWTGRVFSADIMVAKTSTEEPDDHANAEHIATMHPGVALALADWLDKASNDRWILGPGHPASRVANLILGGDDS